MARSSRPPPPVLRSPVRVRTVRTASPGRGCTRTIRPVVRSPTRAVLSGMITTPVGAVSFVATTFGSWSGSVDGVNGDLGPPGEGRGWPGWSGRGFAGTMFSLLNEGAVFQVGAPDPALE